MKLAQLFEQVGRFVYHVTTKDNWESIKRQGILPQDAKGEWAHIGYKNKTFVFEDSSPEALEQVLAILVGKHPGWEEWEDEWDDFHNSLLLLRIDTQRIPDLYLARDPHGGHNDWYQTSTPIPPDAIVGVTPVELE